MHPPTQRGMDSDFRAADYRPGNLPCSGGPGRENEAFSPRNLQEGGYLLRKLVRCGRCGCSCSALTSKQTYNEQVRCSHYYSCLRTTSGFLKQERCSQRRIRADVLDEMVWEEVSTRLQDPALVMEAYQDHNSRRRASVQQDKAGQKDDRLKEQIKLANRELSRLLDAYQYGAIELSELQKRRQLVNSRLEVLNREQELLTKMAAEKQKQSDTQESLAEFASLVSSTLKRISFENKQKLLRVVLDKVVVKDWRVDVHYNIPLPKCTPTPEQKLSTKFDLCSACTRLCAAENYVQSAAARVSGWPFQPAERRRRPTIAAAGLRTAGCT